MMVTLLFRVQYLFGCQTRHCFVALVICTFHSRYLAVMWSQKSLLCVIMIYSGVQVLSTARHSILVSFCSVYTVPLAIGRSGWPYQIQTNVIKTTILVSAFYAVSDMLMNMYYLLLNINPNLRLPNSMYYTAWFISFFYICMNPFIYATKFDPVRRVLVNLIPCMKTPVQPIETVEVAASSKATRPTQSRKRPVQNGMDITNMWKEVNYVRVARLQGYSDCRKL